MPNLRSHRRACTPCFVQTFRGERELFGHAAHQQRTAGEYGRTYARETVDRELSQGELEPIHLLDLYSDLHRQSQRASQDLTSCRISARFLREHYYSNRPLLLKGLAKDSAPVATWSPTFFAENYGSVSVQITAGRTRYPDYESNFRNTIQTITMAEFVRRLDEETNDFYIVARNYFFENPALALLRKETSGITRDYQHD